MDSSQVTTIEQMEEYFNQEWLKEIPPGGSPVFQHGMNLAISFVKNMIPNLKKTYYGKGEQLKPQEPIPFKVGQILRRTSDGLKCMIVQNHSLFVYMIQQNNGRQFANKVLWVGTDIPPKILAEISGGYSFVTEKQGLELGLAWAREEASRDKRNVYGTMPSATIPAGSLPRF